MGSTDDLLSEIESLPMPSVKELTKQFDTAAPELIKVRKFYLFNLVLLIVSVAIKCLANK